MCFKVRGFSNNFWGWGREDDEFYRRIKDNDLQVGDVLSWSHNRVLMIVIIESMALMLI